MMNSTLNPQFLDVFDLIPKTSFNEIVERLEFCSKYGLKKTIHGIESVGSYTGAKYTQYENESIEFRVYHEGVDFPSIRIAERKYDSFGGHLELSELYFDENGVLKR